MRRLLVLLSAAVVTLGAGATNLAVRNGDIVFQTSRSSQSEAIQHATGSAYSHVGLILFRNGRPYVLEAVATVRYTPLDRWVARGKDGHCVVRRLKDHAAVLTPDGLAKLRAVAETFEGRPYDSAFGWSDDRIYCSELVWKLYDRALGLQIGKLQQLKELNLTDPVVLAKLHERYGRQIPVEESVVSPVAMFQSPLLVTVGEQ